VELLDTLLTTGQAEPLSNGERPLRLRPHPIRAQIVDHLEKHGASRISDICGALYSRRNNIQYHLLVLEAASIVQSNIPAGERARFTPYYSLTGESAF
jgi:predicted ArsR family transcriptional regulator